MTQIIEKTLSLDDVELKTEGDAGVFRGYASKFNGIDSYGDTILPGAYQKVLGEKMPPVFLNHNTMDLPIGRYTAMKENAQGLYVEGKLTLSIQKARDVYEAMRAGTIDGLSVGILLSKQDYDWNEDGGRNIKSVSGLREISVCTFPADDRARIGLVKCEDIQGAISIRELEENLRDAGLSKAQAQAFISKAKELILSERDQRDSESEAEKQVLAKLKTIAGRF